MASQAEPSAAPSPGNAEQVGDGGTMTHRMLFLCFFVRASRARALPVV